VNFTFICSTSRSALLNSSSLAVFCRYQLDGYFNGGTAPWLRSGAVSSASSSSGSLTTPELRDAARGACTFSNALNDTQVEGCCLGCKSFHTLAEAESACSAERSCFGVTLNTDTNGYELREGSLVKPSKRKKKSWLVTNAGADGCRAWRPVPISPNPTWIRRGTAAYGGLSRSDPEAVWSYQGFAFAEWQGPDQGGYIDGFVAAVPRGKFVVIDMTLDGAGQWRSWNNANFWGAPFIWTALHDMGANDGLKGNLSMVRTNGSTLAILMATTQFVDRATGEPNGLHGREQWRQRRRYRLHARRHRPGVPTQDS
jgi:hypothetical protein